MKIRDMILSSESLKEIVEREKESQSYDAWSEKFAEITATCNAAMPPETRRIDRLLFLTRQCYLAGFLYGLTLMNDTIKSFAEDETESD